MDYVRPSTWAEALAVRARRPDAVPIQGGTDVMAELNLGLRGPGALLDLSAVAELATWELVQDVVRVGAGVCHTRLIDELGGLLPGLAQAARSIGSSQIRNRGTLGGATARPDRDVHPPLLAGGAVIEVESAGRGIRMIPAASFHPSLRQDELIRAVRMAPTRGPEHFAKVGIRNAMVTPLCSFAVALRADEHRVGTGLAAASPVPCRAADAEEFLADALDWDGLTPLSPTTARRFGELIADAARPVEGYRRHALSVLARRTLGRAWRDHRTTRTET